MDNINIDDLMSKVMNRRLGGGTSSCESSPIKQHTMSSENGASLQSDTQNCLSPSYYPDKRSSEIIFSKSKHHKELVDIDEIDGFTEDKIETANCTDFKYCKSDSGRYSKAIEATDINVNCVRQNHAITEEDTGYDHGEYEYVITNENVKGTVEPRIEMFNESDSNSNSNPFILSSFQSLNANSNAHIPNTDAENETATCIEKEDCDKSRAENSQEFGWKMEENDYHSSSQSSSHDLYQNEDSVENIDSHDTEKGIKITKSDMSVQNVKTMPETKNESPALNSLKSYLHFEGSDNENGSETVILNTKKHVMNESENKRSAVFCFEKVPVGENHLNKTVEGFNENSMTDRNCKEAESEVESDNKDVRHNDIKEVKEQITEKSSVKKSRKQNVPKRVRKFESFIENENVSGGEKIESNKSIDENTFSLKEVRNNIQETADEVTLKENEELTKFREVEQKKTEKSRKQCKPKRIDQLQNISEKASVLGKENETGSPVIVSNINDDTETKYNYLIENKDENIQTDKSKMLENEKPVYLANLNSAYDNSDVEPFGTSEGMEENGATSIKEDERETTEHSVSSLQKTPEGGSLSNFQSLSSNPFYYGFSPDLNLISSLSPGMLQGGTSASGGFALDESGPENLEVIRQLREIRCNRYRKISIAEKREISAYANVHGVSQAATYYNVSKSAVSMWTKLDFSNADEDSGIRRKNCMSGNEKFETLCRKVKNERETKFKGMTKQDKFEVSRYAKLVGVREMSRCLGVALGTVSGWMRQFPYKVETESPDHSNPKKSKETKDNIEKSEATKIKEQKDKPVKRRKSDQSSKISKKQRNSESVEFDTDSYKTIQKDNTMYILPVDVKTENIEEDPSMINSDIKENDETVEASATESDLDCSLEQKDELDKMIAETWQKPDVEKCFEDIKEMIKDSPLEGDDFFRSLFDRVIACRADKYKTLKPSEKLEVVRYAKRIGVRRVAKIMGLATGTLSGWNTKYQSSLSLTDPSLDVSNKTDLLVSYLSPDKEIEKVSMTPGALMDNSQKSEVTAVKLLFKDRFPTLLQKIEIAKQVKFRNITTDEKIEFVKCSKLVGIRPTARVFGIPIGTLSGWISKYSKLLHPAYHVDVDQDTASNSSESTSQISHSGVYTPNIVGRNAGFQSSMSSNPAWSQMPGITPIGQGLGLNLFPQLPSMPSSAMPISSSYSSSELFSSPLNTSETVPQEYSSDTANENKHLITSQNKIYNDDQTVDNENGNRSERLHIENQSDTTVVIKTEPDLDSQSSSGADFEKEAKLMAEQYLTAAYKKMGIPIG